MMSIAPSSLVALALVTGQCAMAQEGFRNLDVDAGRVIGQIRSFQGLNGTPTAVMAGLPDLIDQYKELRVDQVRTHDVMGPTEIDSRFDYRGSYLTFLVPDSDQRAHLVKSGNAGIIFPNMSADPERPESYNFGPTDKVIAGIRASGAEVYYRIGRSYGANTEPPADFDKFANIVKHIAMHYNQGWASGFHYNIRYWEFWNEPEGFWSGTPEQFYALYAKTALALKSVDPAMKVGGDARAIASDDGPWREGFIDYCAAHKLPLDFYSWHTYAGANADPYDAVRLAGEIRGILDTKGFPKAESILSEWNLNPDFTALALAELQSAHNAAYVGAVMCYFQDAALDHAHFYRGDAAWMGIFDLQGDYYKPAYAYKAMGQMLDTPQRLEVKGTDAFGFAGLAGRSEDGKKVQIFLSNYRIREGYKPVPMPFPVELTDPTTPDPWANLKAKPLPNRTDIVYRDNSGYKLRVTNLPWGSGSYTMKRFRISKRERLELVEEQTFSGSTLTLSNPFGVDTLELIVLERK